MKSFFFIFIFLGSVFQKLSAQNGFRGAAILGMTTCQIDGDDLLGYNKVGVSTGLKVAFDFTTKVSGNLELLYSQRGASEKFFKNGEEDTNISLGYFELPIYLTFNDWYIETEGYHKMSGQLGFSYASLFSSKLANTEFDDLNFNKADLSYLIGASFHFTKHWALTVRYTRAISKLLEDETLSNKHLLSYFWTIRTEYYF